MSAGSVSQNGGFRDKPGERFSGQPGVPGEWNSPDSGQDFDVALKARINLEGIGELAAEACHFDGLTWA